MNKEVSKVTKKREKDNLLMQELLKELTREEMKATVYAEDERVFIGLHQRYAEKYKLELPSWLRPPPDEGYHIAKIDRVTGQDLLPVLLNKRIFTNYSSLPTKEEIIKQECIRLKKGELDFEETRAALTKVGEYRQGFYVTRDYGDFVIGFSCKLYLSCIKEHEDALMEALKDPLLFPEITEQIEQGLENVRLYRLAWKIAHVVLAEVYRQRKVKGLVISKEQMIRLLGYKPNEKQIYQRVERALNSLLVCSYKIWDYKFTPGYKKRTNRPSSKEIGLFIWRLKITSKDYILNVSDIYVGCVRQLLLEDKAPKKERRKLFERGYYDWTSRIYTLTKDDPISVELLSLFFIREAGNKKLKKPKIKVITHTVGRLAQEALITHSRASRRYDETLSALEGVRITEKIEPPIHELKRLKPAKGLKAVVHIHMRSSAKELDKLIKSKIKERK